MAGFGDLAQQDEYPNVDWSKYNQPFGALTDPNPVVAKLPSGPNYGGDIHKSDIDRAADLGLSFSGGGLATKGAGMGDVLGSRARDPNMWHGISQVKLPRPVAEMASERLQLNPTPSVEQRISPENLQGGILLPAIGDRSATGFQVTRVGEAPPFANPVEMQGGHGYMAANADKGHVWASDKGVITTMANRARQLAEKEGTDVYLPYTAMGERSVDFSHHMSDTLAEMVKNAPISKEAAADFNAAMKTDMKDFKGDPNFPGINDPGLRDYLIGSSGNVRNKFAKLMDTAKYQAMGMPSVAEARHAVIDPRLLDVPTGAAGLSVARVSPGAATEPSGHRTYSTALAGDYLGGFGQSVPKEVMYPDIMSAYAQQGYKPVQFDYLMSRGRAPVFQRANQQWLDNMMKYLQQPIK